MQARSNRTIRRALDRASLGWVAVIAYVLRDPDSTAAAWQRPASSNGEA